MNPISAEVFMVCLILAYIFMMCVFWRRQKTGYSFIASFDGALIFGAVIFMAGFGLDTAVYATIA